MTRKEQRDERRRRAAIQQEDAFLLRWWPLAVGVVLSGWTCYQVTQFRAVLRTTTLRLNEESLDVLQHWQDFLQYERPSPAAERVDSPKPRTP